MRRRVKHQGSTGPFDESDRSEIEVLFDHRVFEYMLQALSESRSVEEGGKYVGYYLQAGDPRFEQLGVESKNAVAVIDFLPSGPNALRTAGELRPDGVYQEALFRRMEARDPSIEHVGTWHSHHCNGLERLSGGDIDGYFKTVNKPAYNLDFFVASLVKRIPKTVDDRDWIDHFLFLRGAHVYSRITGSVKLIDWQSTFGDMTGHAITHPQGEPESTRREQEEPQAAVVWFDTGEGRSVLAADKRFFDSTFRSVTATRRQSQVTITGRVGSRTVAVTYPYGPGEEQVSILVEDQESTLMRIECTLRHRSLAYKAALTEIEEAR